VSTGAAQAIPPPRPGNKTGSHVALPLPADPVAAGRSSNTTPPPIGAKVGSQSGSTAALGGPPPPPKVGAKSGPTAALVPAPPVLGAIRSESGRPLLDDSLTIPEVVPPVAPKLAVPIGEFDSGIGTIEAAKERNDQKTVVRDAAEALLKIPDQVVPLEALLDESPESIKTDLAEAAGALRGDATSIDPSTRPFERGDPTAIGGARGDATEIQGHNASSMVRAAGRLRPSAALRRKRGALGDVFYVFTALGGMRRSKRELAALEQRRDARQAERKRHLVTLGRTAVISEGFDHPALAKSREALAAVEDERSQHAGAVAASNAELERVRRDRDANVKTFAEEKTKVEGELADLAKKLAPLEKEATAAKKKAADLREQLQRIAKKLTETEGLLVSVKGEKMDKAQIHADIATLRADRASVQKDEPVIAAELDALMPRIAAIEAARSEAEKRKKDLEDGEALDQKRTAELLEALGAKRKVVERASAEAEAARDKVLFDLGERLYVDRPSLLGAQLAPIDAIDLELGEDDRRIMELREILSNIDRWKLARGIAMITVALAVLGTIVGWLIYKLA
jgi:prefoldin subunit 5